MTAMDADAVGLTEAQIRDNVLGIAHQLVEEGIPYIWGAKNPEKDGGLDCSGFVTFVLEAAGVEPDGFGQIHNAASLAALYDTIDAEFAQGGDLVVYGPGGAVEHIMMLVGDGTVVGSSGGGHTCTTPAIAKQLGAGVHYRPSVNYRNDLVGYRRLPIIAS